jgi:uncharacterized cupredoxin-like copper-binding protein
MFHFSFQNLLVATISLTLCAACSNNDAALREAALKSLDSVAQARATEVHTPDDAQPIIPTNKIEPRGATTEMKFANDGKYKFGKIKDGDKVTHDFEFTNAGKEPLVVTNCKASCGCTVPEWSQSPVLPGKTGKIHVVFDSKGKAGTQVKTITVTANTEPSRSVIALVGEVL